MYYTEAKYRVLPWILIPFVKSSAEGHNAVSPQQYKYLFVVSRHKNIAALYLAINDGRETAVNSRNI